MFKKSVQLGIKLVKKSFASSRVHYCTSKLVIDSFKSHVTVFSKVTA